MLTLSSRPAYVMVPAFLLGLVSVGLAGEADAGALTVSVTGLRVVASAEERVRAFDSQAGTAVALLVSAPGGGIVRFDSSDSTVAKFVDEKGNDLQARIAGPAAPLHKLGFSVFPKISADGKLCAIEFSGPGLPAKGSARLKIEGVLTLILATQKKESVHKDVAVRGGTIIAEPNLPLKIVDVRRAEDSTAAPPGAAKPAPREITFRAEREIDEIAGMRFFSADGKEIKSRNAGIAKMGLLGHLAVDWTFALDEPADSLTVKIQRWTDMRKQRVPFALTVEVGL